MDEQGGRHWFKRGGDHFLAAFPCPEKLWHGFESMTAEDVLEWSGMTEDVFFIHKTARLPRVIFVR